MTLLFMLNYISNLCISFNDIKHMTAWSFDNVELLKLRCGSSHWANDYL